MPTSPMKPLNHADLNRDARREASFRTLHQANAMERRKAISGLILFLTVTIRLNVDGDTFNDAAAFRYVTLNGSRYTSRINAP